jgi:hypothetical protein
MLEWNEGNYVKWNECWGELAGEIEWCKGVRKGLERGVSKLWLDYANLEGSGGSNALKLMSFLGSIFGSTLIDDSISWWSLCTEAKSLRLC